jgi:hypothetical protein
MTGVGLVAVRQPRVRDREVAAGDRGRIRSTPAILPPYLQRSKSTPTDRLQGYRVHISPTGSAALHDCLAPASIR